MSIKKKMGMGIATGALGLALVGGGSFAAFNDVEAIDNTFAAGTLNLTTSEGAEAMFELNNLKPGDSFEKTLVLGNGGTLDINEILANVSFDGHSNVSHPELPDNDMQDFLNQFNIKILQDGVERYNGSLGALNGVGNVDVTQNEEGEPGLPVEGKTNIDFKVTFVNDDTLHEGSKLFEQNKYQGESANIHIDFEATQMPGEEK
ncbi:TasA family protein [Halobacillus naozhouensis]|uniref:TasA family protein n=1 Tax=Halobacillus naozhouensis TaxID=554880 RepID=A0ABY8IUQ0_9BACI|nr:TasA family protein [Halobacillus naozhouensis]WFT73830.1 TasA family protein [Halobacillus naozhouensis]